MPHWVVQNVPTREEKVPGGTIGWGLRAYETGPEEPIWFYGFRQDTGDDRFACLEATIAKAEAQAERQWQLARRALAQGWPATAPTPRSLAYDVTGRAEPRDRLLELARDRLEAACAVPADLAGQPLRPAWWG